MLDILRDMFPGRAMLEVDEVAAVLRRTGAGSYEQTRMELAAGLIVPGLRKTNGRWLVPIVALARALDGLVDTDAATQQAAPKPRPASHKVSQPATPSSPRRGRKPDSVRAREREEQQRIRALAFWGGVIAEHDAIQLLATLPETGAVSDRRRRTPRM